MSFVLENNNLMKFYYLMLQGYPVTRLTDLPVHSLEVLHNCMFLFFCIIKMFHRPSLWTVDNIWHVGIQKSIFLNISKSEPRQVLYADLDPPISFCA